MRERPAERRRFRGDGIDMDELPVFRDLGEGVDARLAVSNQRETPVSVPILACSCAIVIVGLKGSKRLMA